MRLLFLIVLFALSFNTLATNMYVAKVAKVDGNNVLHTMQKGRLVMLSFAYLMTPVRGEPMHDEVNKYLVDNLEGEWVRVTTMIYGQNALVVPSLIRTYDNKMINSELLKLGYALPDMNTAPPPSIVNIAAQAKEANVGLFSLSNEFVHARYLSKGVQARSIFSDMEVALKKAKEKNIEPYLLVESSQTAYPMKCLLSVKASQMVSTVYVAKHRGYSISDDCPKKTE